MADALREFRADADDARVWLKFLSDPEADALLRSERRLLEQLPKHCILACRGPELRDGRTALLHQLPEGIFLSDLLPQAPLPIEDFLRLALDLASCLHELHQAGVVHRAIAADCIFLTETGGARLCGFERATQLPRSAQRIDPQLLTRASCAGMAPEQTGRINRLVDQRTDLFALGVLFYQLLSARPAFDAGQPMARLHQLLARMPPTPVELRPDLPAMLSAVTMKLLAKEAGQRYQSAAGLCADLRRCIESWQSRQAIADFPLGRQDASGRLRLPARLYGRDQALGQLNKALERIRQTRPELLTVVGYSGIGKTSLVMEMQGPVVAERGWFAGGKFDQLTRDQPYSALIQALTDLTRQLLTEDEADIEQRKQRLARALSGQARLLIEVVPELHHLLDDQADAAPLGPLESRNRLQALFLALIEALATPRQPLVLFLDDLQWIDQASLELISTLMTQGRAAGFLLIGAYRDNEVGAEHPLSALLERLRDMGRLEECRLQALQTQDLNRLLVDTLDMPAAELQELGELVQTKTLGNPLYVRTLLQGAQAKSWISPAADGGWTWDLDGIRSLRPGDDLAQLLASRLAALPEASRAVLRLAACIGNAFRLELLRGFAPGGEAEVQAALAPALQQGLIEARPDASFAFAHDRIQELAYAAIPTDQRAPLHLSIGRALRQRQDAGDNAPVFELVDQLNRALPLLEDPRERQDVIELNLRAARQARKAAAFEAAYSYFDHAADLIDKDDWRRRHATAFALHLGRAETAALCQRMDTAEADAQLLLRQARDEFERGEVHALRMQYCETQGRFAESVAAGRAALAEFGIDLPDDAQAKQRLIEQTLADIRARLGQRAVAELLQLPRMQDPAARLCMRLLMTLWPSAYIAGDKPLTVLIAARMTALSLQHGNTAESAYGYVTHAITLANLSRDYATAYEFGRLALEVNQGFDDLRSRAKINHMFSCYIGFWRRPIAESFPYSQAAYRSGLESGDYIYAAYGCFHESWHALFSGMPLARYQDTYAARLAFIERSGNRSFLDAQRLMLQWGRSLRGQTREPAGLDDADFISREYLQRYQGVDFFLAFHHIARLMLLYLFGELQQARRMAIQAEQVAEGVRGMIWDAWLCLYQALVLAAQTRPEAKTRRRLDQLIERMALWADNCPDNFAHLHQLLLAERAAQAGDISAAIEAYERALGAVKQSGFVHIQALIEERYALFWLARDNPRLARIHLRDAYGDYGVWGAQGKQAQLSRCYPQLLDHPSDAAAGIGPGDALDAETLLQAGHALSRETDADKLPERLLRLLTQGTGAARALLFLVQDGRLLGWRQARLGGSGLELAELADADWRNGPVERLVNYVRHSGEGLRTEDAAGDSRLASLLGGSPPPGSVLASPLLNQDELEGVVYLENPLVSGAFDAERQRLVEVLAAQAAIALRNARLIQGLRDEAQRRSRAEQRLREVAAGTASAYGEDFFRQLVLHLSKALQVRMAFVTECSDNSRRHLRALAFIDREQLIPDVEYDLEGTPCETVIGGDSCFYPDQLERHFPKEAGLQSYLGVPMTDAAGEVLGHLAVADDSPMVEDPDDLALLRIFAVRAGAELERQRAQAEALRSQQLLAERERLAAIGRFASMIVHEIRSPLSTMGLALDYLQQNQTLPERAMKRLELACTERLRLQDLLGEILLYAKPQQMQTSRMQLDPLVAAQMEHQAPRHAQLSYQPPDRPLWVMADADKLKQVLLNLLNNAIEAVQPEQAVSVTLFEQDDQAVLQVSNPGQIPADVLARLPEPFLTTKSAGTGLGLAIVQRILEAHRGGLDIRVDEAADQVTVSARLPLVGEQD